MNHQAIIDQLSSLAPQLKAAASPEDVLIKYASDKNLSVAQLERIGQIYNIAKTLNFMDKSAARGDSFKVLDNEKMLAKYTKFKPKEKEKEASNDWGNWFDAPTQKAASEADVSEKSAIIKEEDGKYTVYSEDGSKRLSKPGTKEEAVKRLRQVEYFKKHKKANSMPNLMGMAKDELYSDHVVVEHSPLPSTVTRQLKDELNKEAQLRYELETTAQVIDDSAYEINKIASELLEMHRLAPLPFAEMERDAFYCSNGAVSVKQASDIISDIFKQKGWNLDRHDFKSAAPRLVRDKYNVLPLFKSAAENLELHKAAKSYKEHLEKSAMVPYTGGGPLTTPSNALDTRPPFVDFDIEPPEGRPTRDVNGKSKTIDINAGGASSNKRKGQEDKGDDDKKLVDTLLNNIKTTLSPDTHFKDVNKVPSLISDLAPKKNKKQMEVDKAFNDTKRLAVVQSLLLTDPIIGEADPEMVLSLYNTLASANPEIVNDKNLLRFALREALQYEAVPLHTYKDLITMGKERAQTEDYQNSINTERYKI